MCRHLGQQKQFLPPSRGFDSYFGIPYSDDMGASAWNYYISADRPPLPLLSNFDIIEQPTDLNKLTDRYVNASATFIAEQSAATTPWLLYMAFNHVHTPDFASKKFCNVTRRGRFGDALMEVRMMLLLLLLLLLLMLFVLMPSSTMASGASWRRSRPRAPPPTR